MKIFATLFLASVVSLQLNSCLAQETNPAKSSESKPPSTAKPAEDLAPELKAFAPMLGKTFRGEFANSTPDKPVIDIARWERAMNGKAIRTLHSINDGEYGGESIIMWDPERKAVAFWYFTTAGFHTTGTMTIEGNVWTSVEKVTGNANGITEVKAVQELKPDGTLYVRSEYLKDGKWEKGRETTYKESSDSQVKFR